jgi:hypothetical protein
MIASRFLANAEMPIAIGIFRTLAKDILLVCSCVAPHEVCNSVRVLLVRTSVCPASPAKLGRPLDARTVGGLASKSTPEPLVGFRRYRMTVPAIFEKWRLSVGGCRTPATSVCFSRPEFHDDFLSTRRWTPREVRIPFSVVPMPLVQADETSGSAACRRSVSAWSAAGAPRAAR